MTRTFYDLKKRWRKKDVVCSTRPLTAALCYDRVIDLGDAVNADDLHTPAFQYGTWIGPRRSSALLLGWHKDDSDSGDLVEVATHVMLDCAEDLASKLLAFRSMTGAHLIPVLDGLDQYQQVFPKGYQEVIVTALTDLAVVDESQLTMRQVVEFRRDHEASRKYRRLLQWLEKEIEGKTVQELIDTIAESLSDYEWALKKHGIKTVIGAVSETFDGKYLVGASMAAGSLTIAGHPTLGILTGVGITIGKMTVKLATDFLELRDTERKAGPEIAWLIETKKQLGN